jgi:hypothetical protein
MSGRTEAEITISGEDVKTPATVVRDPMTIGSAARKKQEWSVEIINELRAETPATVVRDPMTGEEFLLLDPGLTVQRHKVDVITCDDAEGFQAAVLAAEGENKLVELRTDGTFAYQNALGGVGTRVVSFKLVPSPTAKVLCLDRVLSLGQRELVRLHAQWPDVLTPDQGGVEVWDGIAAYKAAGATKIEIVHGDDSISYLVERKDGSADGRLPTLWTAASPVFEGHAEQLVTLRLDITHPEADPKTAQVSGALTFTFSLWQPAASEVLSLAMNDACEEMRTRLPEFTVIRGRIG